MEGQKKLITSAASANMCFDIEWQYHLAGDESQIESSVQRMKFIAKIPLHLKAQARYKPFLNHRNYQQQTYPNMTNLTSQLEN
jgi:hypothetical protein